MLRLSASRVIGALVLLIALLGGGAWWYIRGRVSEVPPSLPRVTNYEECVAAGYPVLESYPLQCRTPDGRTFTQNIGDATDLRDRIQVDVPQPNASVQSPLRVSGRARGPWYFEADFPVRIEDRAGAVLASGAAQAQGEWMTEAFVPFQVALTFVVTQSTPAVLVLERSNPSGLPEHAAALRIPITLEPGTGANRTVQLSFYRPSQDRDAQGNLACSRQGLSTVQRTIPRTITPIQDAVRLLLRGELTAAERAQGLTTEFPLPGVALEAASLRDGVLTLTFRDPERRTSGGSCRAGVLWFQIEATAKQFPEVREVRYQPEDLFQP
ncbi:hypothetical protein HYV74_04995 [Candidatus Uhrbacteria bacterium]|nr:hypothetical protein [Candidatus Uhrbacteria bacterium]